MGERLGNSNVGFSELKASRKRAVVFLLTFILISPIPVVIVGEKKLGIALSAMIALYALVNWLKCMISIDSFKCPRCGKSFIRKGFLANPFTSSCMHCNYNEN